MSGLIKHAFYGLTVILMVSLSSGCSSDSDGDSGSGDTTPTLPPTSAVLGSATAQNGLVAAHSLFNVQSFLEDSAIVSTTFQAAFSPARAPIPPGTVLDCVKRR